MIGPNDTEGVFIVVHGSFIPKSEVGARFFSDRIEVVGGDMDNQYFYADVLNLAAETIWNSLGWYGKFRRFLVRIDKAMMFLFMK